MSLFTTTRHRGSVLAAASAIALGLALPGASVSSASAHSSAPPTTVAQAASQPAEPAPAAVVEEPSPDLSALTTTNGNSVGGTDVGIWYCTYYKDPDWESGVWDYDFGNAGYPPSFYKPLSSNTPNDYRQYQSDDPAVIDLHLQKIAAAKIDFLLFELTPGGLGGYRDSMKPFVENAKKVVERLKIWNETHSWQIKYAVGAGAHPDVYGGDPIALAMEKQAKDVLDNFVNKLAYGGPTNYYHLNGKPLIVFWGDYNHMETAWNSYSGDKTHGNQFTIRYAGAPIIAGSYGWNPAGEVPLDSEVETIAPGWEYYLDHSRDFSRNYGQTYQNSWNRVLANPLPQIVMIATFNDYLEHMAVWTSDTTNVPAEIEKWQEAPGGPLKPSMYWDMTVSNIAKLRGLPSFDANDDSAEVTYSGTWTYNSYRPGAYGDDDHYSDAPNAYAEYQFTGTSVKYVAMKDFNLGKVDVYIDDRPPVTVDLYSPAQVHKTVVFEQTGLPNTAHKIRVARTGTKNPSSAGTYIDVDAFDSGVSEVIVNDDSSKIAYTGTWTDNNNRSGAHNGDDHYSDDVNAAAEFSFTGTNIKYIALKDFNLGKADVYIDDLPPVTVDLYSPSQVHRAVVFEKSGLANTTHKIKVVRTGTKNPSAAGTYIDVDAFAVDTVSGPQPQVFVANDDAGGITYHQSWTDNNNRPGAYNSDDHYSDAVDAHATFAFNGTEVSYTAIKDFNLGKVDVFIDNEPPVTVDLYSPTQTVQSIVFTRTGLSDGPHTIKIARTGTKNPSSAGTYIDLDTFTWVD